jgi:hypothetical protein
MHLTGVRRLSRNEVEAVALFLAPPNSKRKLKSELVKAKVQWTKDTISSSSLEDAETEVGNDAFCSDKSVHLPHLGIECIQELSHLKVA